MKMLFFDFSSHLGPFYAKCMIYEMYCKSIKIIFYRLGFILCKIYEIYAIMEYDWASDVRRS